MTHFGMSMLWLWISYIQVTYAGILHTISYFFIAKLLVEKN